MNSCKVEARDGWHCVLVEGEVDLSWSGDIRKVVLAALKQSDDVGVDLNAVTYIDSSGIAALVEGLQVAKADGKSFVLCGVSAPVLSVLSLARLDKVFEIQQTL